MKIRQLLTASALYGAADMLVLGVSGFLLLPLYTHALSQNEFGQYVIVKTNIDLISYVIQFGLLSAAGRLYFDYRGGGEPRRYMNSILMFFLLTAAATGAVFFIAGEPAWRQLSPSTPSLPYLWYALGVATLAFTAGLGSLWLRVDNRASSFVGLQVTAAMTVTVAAFVSLEVLHLGLPGLLAALAIGYVPATLTLLWRIGPDLGAGIRRADIGPSLHYGLPFAVSYIAYFILNRFSVLTLQRNVALEDIATFGLAQQLALLIAVVSQSFGKAMQPAVFGASPYEAPGILQQSSRLFILLVFGAASAAVMFASEIISIVAPAGYHSGVDVLLVLLVATFIYSLSLVSSTTLEYHRHPRLSAAMTVLGAIMSVVLNLLLIPRMGLMGGAIALLGAYVTMTLSSLIVAWRISGQSYFGEIAVVTVVLGSMALVAAWSGWGSIGMLSASATKLAMVGTAFAGLAALLVPQSFAKAVARVRGRFGSQA